MPPSHRTDAQSPLLVGRTNPANPSNGTTMPCWYGGSALIQGVAVFRPGSPTRTTSCATRTAFIKLQSVRTEGGSRPRVRTEPLEFGMPEPDFNFTNSNIRNWSAASVLVQTDATY